MENRTAVNRSGDPPAQEPPSGSDSSDDDNGQALNQTSPSNQENSQPASPEVGGSSNEEEEEEEEDQHDNHHQVEQPASPHTEALNRATQTLLSQYNSDERMQITSEERQQALAIKRAIEGLPDLNNLSDFFYCQLAIVGKGDVQWAVSRAYLLQSYKEQYGILDTLDDCVRHIPMQTADNFLLSVDFNLHQGGYICAYDGPKFDLSVLKSDKKFRGVMQRCFYLPHMLMPDLAAVRAGITILFECDGYGTAGMNDFCFKTFRRVASGGWSVYPASYAQSKFFNSPHIVNYLVGLAKPALSPQLASSFKVGCNFPGGRLDRFFNVPTKEAAVARLCVKLEELSHRRYKNERRFSLEDPTETALASERNASP